MSDTLETLGREKDLLLARSALCRLRLRRETHRLCESTLWRRAAVAAVAVPAVGRFALGLVLPLVGLARAWRVVMVAGRIVLFTKLAISLIGGVRDLGRSIRGHGSVRWQTDMDARLP